MMWGNAAARAPARAPTTRLPACAQVMEWVGQRQQDRQAKEERKAERLQRALSSDAGCASPGAATEVTAARSVSEMVAELEGPPPIVYPIRCVSTGLMVPRLSRQLPLSSGPGAMGERKQLSGFSEGF
eukprot:5370929-Prymnesium_polylepis.2